MMNHRKSIIALVVVAVVASSIYTAYELRPPTAFRTGDAQYNNRTFEERMQLIPISVHGRISDVGTELWTITAEIEDEQIPPNVISVLTEKVPKQKLTIDVIEVYKNVPEINIGKSIIVYDRANGIGENYDGERTEFYYDETVEHHIGDEGIFLITLESNGKLTTSGFGYYPIVSNNTTITSEFDKLLGNKELDLEHAKNFSRSLP